MQNKFIASAVGLGQCLKYGEYKTKTKIKINKGKDQRQKKKKQIIQYRKLSHITNLRK